MPGKIKQITSVTLAMGCVLWWPAFAESQVDEKDPRISAADSRRAQLLDDVIPVGEYCLDLLGARHRAFDPIEGRNVLKKSFSVDQMSAQEKAACRERWARRYDQQLNVAAADLRSHAEGLGILFRSAIDAARLYREHIGSLDEDFDTASALYQATLAARESYLDSVADLWGVWKQWRSRFVAKSSVRGNPRDPLSYLSPPLPDEFVAGTVKIKQIVREQAGWALEVTHSGPADESLVEVEIPSGSGVYVVRTQIFTSPPAPTPLIREFFHTKEIEDVTRQKKFDEKTRTLSISAEHAAEYAVCSWRHWRKSANGKITGPDLIDYTDTSITYHFSAAFHKGKRGWHTVKVTLVAIRRTATEAQKAHHGCGKLSKRKPVGLCYVIETTADDNSHQVLLCLLSRNVEEEFFQCDRDWNGALKVARCVTSEDVCESLHLGWPDILDKEYDRGLVAVSKVKACQ